METCNVQGSGSWEGTDVLGCWREVLMELVGVCVSVTVFLIVTIGCHRGSEPGKCGDQV